MSYSVRENTEVESLDSIMMKEIANSSVENDSIENNDEDDVQHYNLDTIKGFEDERYSYNYDPEAETPLSKVESIKEIRDEIPDKFSGWGLASVIACAIFNLNTWGANSAYALYFEVYLDNDIFSGANKYDYAILGGLAFSSGLCLSPFFNYVIGKIGVKVTIFIGLIINFAAILLASYATKLWQIYCTQGVMSGFGMGVVCVANVNIVPQWFKGGPGGKRNLAMGLGACGSGIGGIIYNIGLESLLQRRSYKWSLRVQAIMGLGLNLIALLMIKTRNANIKPVFKVYDPLIWTNFGCLCLLVWIMFTLFGYVVLMYNLGDFTVSLGYTQKQASVVSTMVPVGIVWGRPLCGKIGDIIGPINITIIASWLVALFSLAMWIPCRNYATAIALAMMCGSLMGTIWLTLASINATIIGLKKVGISMSVCWVATGLFGFASPIIGIALKKNGPEFDPTMYQDASIFVGLCYIMAGVVLVFTRGWLISRNRKVNPETDDEDDVLRIKVSTKEMLSNMFNIEKV